MAGTLSVTDQVVNYIQMNIESGAWPIGSKLPSESQLCDSLGESRTSVRSALQQFIAIGAVESIHGKGSFLRSNDLCRLRRSETITVEMLQNVLSACAVIRPAICVEAMLADEGQLIPDLRKILDRMHSLKPHQLREMMELAHEFHKRMSSSLKNPALDNIREQFNTVISHFQPTESDNVLFYGNLYYHNSMLEAIEHQDAERLAKAVRNYYSNMSNFYPSPDSPYGASFGEKNF